MAYQSECFAEDGHVLTVTEADALNSMGTIIILHAVYGVTDHIVKLCDKFAEAGISAKAPWLFDRIGDGVVHPYTSQGTDAGRGSYAGISEREILLDVAACSREAQKKGPVAICGFCTGGTWAWVSAALLDLEAALVFYGSQVADHVNRKPKCPVELHYGDSDFVVPFDVITQIKDANPGIALHIYPGCNHAFFNPDQRFYDQDASSLLWSRSLEFLRQRFSEIKRKD
jgi:carboxymethylenebutenolidase